MESFVVLGATEPGPIEPGHHRRAQHHYWYPVKSFQVLLGNVDSAVNIGIDHYTTIPAEI